MHYDDVLRDPRMSFDQTPCGTTLESAPRLVALADMLGPTSIVRSSCRADYEAAMSDIAARILERASCRD